MDGEDATSDFYDDGERREEPTRRDILAPAIYDVIAALGGYEGDTYKLGDECYGCLKDLKKFWRKDDTDDERTVARIFWEARLLPNELIPILLETAGKGLVGDKCAIACADIITAMSWPIDLSEELKELDEELDKGTDYTRLLRSHLHYKAALLKPGVIEALLGIMLPCIAKDKKQRKEREIQIVNVILHLFRNLAFIKDQPHNMHASSDQVEFASLQSKLVKTFQEAYIFDLFTTIASNATDPFFNQWNTLIMEIYYLLFRGVAPLSLAMDQGKSSQSALSSLLAAENKIKLENARRASSRHSRFGTTIAISLNPTKKRADGNFDGEPENADSSSHQRIVAHKQQALNQEAGALMDGRKRKLFKKINKVDELGVQSNLDIDAKKILRAIGKTFIQACFNTFLGSILKDIKSERPKITEKDHLRLLFTAKWFLEFFLAVRARQVEDSKKECSTGTSNIWGFDMVGEIVERSWIIWILKRMRQAVEDKPKLWTELQAGIECLTQLLSLIDLMRSAGTSLAEADPELGEASALLQQQIVYNGEVLDIAVDALRVYREGLQSLRYLDASVRLGYALLRMLEKWSKERGGGELYVRKKKARRRRAKALAEGDDELDGHGGEDEEDEPSYQEITFTFESFEMKFAHEEITRTLLIYLSRHEEFASPEQLKRVVNLLHRQAVKAKAEGIFFKVSTLSLFRFILSKQSTLPKEQPYKDLVNLTNFILKKYFKAIQEDPMLVIESFFPKNRNRWKQYSSWMPEAIGKGLQDDDYLDNKRPPEVQVKRGYSWSQQLGIAIACLVDKGEQKLIDWVKEILVMVIGQRQRIIDETDGSSSGLHLNDDGEDEDDQAAIERLRKPSNEAIAKFEDYQIPYINDEQADAATKNPHLKLVFRLTKSFVLDENADELEWYIPAAILPSELNSSLVVINQFLENPMELEGKKPAQLLSKKTRRRRRRAASESSDEAHGSDVDDEEPRKQRAKKKKEKQQYKSAQFIEDSDGEYPLGADEAFWARERELRERTERLAAETGGSGAMRAQGTKKRKKRKGRTIAEAGNGEDGREGSPPGTSGGKRKRGGTPPSMDRSSASSSYSSASEDEDETGTQSTSATTPQSASSITAKKASRPRPRPRPRPMFKDKAGPGSKSEENIHKIGASAERDATTKSATIFSDEEATNAIPADAPSRLKTKTKARAVLSDSEEE